MTEVSQHTQAYVNTRRIWTCRSVMRIQKDIFVCLLPLAFAGIRFYEVSSLMLNEWHRGLFISSLAHNMSTTVCSLYCLFFPFSRIFEMRYLRDYLELEQNKNISSHLLVEICSIPGSFEMMETIRGYQNNIFSFQKKSEVILFF